MKFENYKRLSKTIKINPLFVSFGEISTPIKMELVSKDIRIAGKIISKPLTPVNEGRLHKIMMNRLKNLGPICKINCVPEEK